MVTERGVFVLRFLFILSFDNLTFFARKMLCIHNGFSALFHRDWFCWLFRSLISLYGKTILGNIVFAEKTLRREQVALKLKII